MNSTTNPKVSCIANYTYDASEPDELTIRPGDVLRDVDQLPGGWWRGELKGRRGMFPDNFVSVITDQNNSGSPAGVQGRCRAVFSYQPANVDELPLCVGDVLEVLGEVEEGWWQGRRQGRVGVFPSNFVVMLEPPAAATPPFEPAPALPPKPVKEYCRVLFPYTAVNEDELSLSEGDVVALVSRDTADRGWWRGELHGRVGLFPDNFVQLLPSDASNNKISPAPEDESKPERPPAKTTSAIYPVLNKYSEKTASVKELTTSKISMHKENTISKESSTQSTVTHTNKSESEKLVHSKTTDGAGDALKFSDEEIYGSKFSVPKKPSVPLKKSPTPTSGVGGLFSGLKNKMMSSDKDKSEKQSPNLSSGSSNGGEWDRPDGGAASKPAAAAATNTAGANTFDHVERNSILNDPRAGRAKAPRRRPPSQALRDDTPQQIGLSNGHEVPIDKPPAPPDKAEEIKPRTREWEKHKAPWMEELKLNQAKKTSFVADGKSRSVSASSEAGASRAGSTDRILDCGLEEKRSTHSMEMSKSTSSISNRISVLESLESSLEAKVRHSLEPRREPAAAARDDPPAPPTSRPPALHSPTAAGRTLTAMLDDIKKPQAPPPPTAARTDIPSLSNLSPNRLEKIVTSSEKIETSTTKLSSNIIESHKSSSTESEERVVERERPPSALDKGGTLERRAKVEKMEKMEKVEKNEGADALIAQLNNRILNLEKLLEVQNAKFNAAIEHLNTKLSLEVEKRQALQAEIEKLAQCVTQV